MNVGLEREFYGDLVYKFKDRVSVPGGQKTGKTQVINY